MSLTSRFWKSKTSLSPRRKKVFFEPLEPRLLLSADLTNPVPPPDTGFDLTLRLNVSELELVDQNSNVVAHKALNETSAVVINGSGQDDNLTIDFSTPFSLPGGIAFTDPSANDNDTLEIMDATNVWNITGGGQGNVDGAGALEFTGVEDLVGGADADTFVFDVGGSISGVIDGGLGADALIGSDVSSAFNITGINAGTLNGQNFVGIENLIGGADNEDVFILTEGGDVSGVIEGGDRGFDTIVLSGGNFARVTYTASGPDSGTIERDGAVVAYSGMEPITQTGTAAKVVISGSNDADELVLENGASANTLKVRSVNGTIESVSFATPSTSLTINGEGGRDKVEVIENITLPGADLIINSETIVVDASVSISTRKTGGGGNSTDDSGDIAFSGEDITVESGAQLLAHVESGSSYAAGDITIAAVDADYTGIPWLDWLHEQLITPLFGANGVYVNSAQIDVDAATLRGNDVTITSTAEYKSNPVLGQELFDGYKFADLMKLGSVLVFNQNIFSFPLGVLGRIADASVSIAGASVIEAGGDVSIGATAAANGSVTVINPNFSIGFGLAHAKAEAEVGENVEIAAAGGVSVISDSTAKADVLTRTSTNKTKHENTMSLAISMTDVTSRAFVDQNSTITAGENVSVHAKGDNTSSGNAEFAIYGDGTAGVTLGFSWAQSDIQAEVDGVVIATGSDAATRKDFGKSDVSGANDTITLPSHGFQTGDTVVYRNGGGQSIGGLEDGQEYAVLVVDQDTIKLTNGRAIDIDNSSANPGAQHTLSIRNFKEFDPSSDVSTSSDTITISNHGFTTGQRVTYSSLENDVIGGLNDAADYYAIRVNNNAIKLAASETDATAGTAIDLTSVGSGASHMLVYTAAAPLTFTASDDNVVDSDNNTITVANHGLQTGDVVIYQVDPTVTTQRTVNRGFLFDPSSVVNLTDDTITIEAHGLSTGDSVTYSPGVGDVMGGLAADTEYFAIKVDDDTIKLAASNSDANNGTAINLTSYGAGDAHSLMASELLDFDDTPLGGLEDGKAYFVVALDGDTLMLADSYEEAINAAPIDLDPSSASAAGHFFALDSAVGIGVKAELTASETGAAVSGVGGAPLLKDYLLKKELQYGKLNQLKNNLVDKLKGKAAQAPAGSDTSKFSASGAIAFTYGDHDVIAKVGGNASLKSDQDIEVQAIHTHTIQNAAESSISKPDESKGALSVAVIVGLYDSNVVATIDAGATVDASRDLSVKSEIVYPFLTDLTFKAIFGKGENESYHDWLGRVMDQKGGLQGKLFNSWARSVAGGDQAPDFAIAGSVNFLDFVNQSKAIIASGAQINQNASYQTGFQSVSVEATTKMQFFNLTGVFDINFSEDGLKNMVKKKDPFALLNPMGSSGGKGGMGGSFFLVFMDNDTIAEIKDAVAIRVGASGSFDLNAATDITNIVLTQSGATADKFAVSGTFSYNDIENYTVANLESGAKITSGDVSISAKDAIFYFNISGGVVTGNNVGVGATVGINDFDRETYAGIGNLTGGPGGTASVDTVDITGDLSISAVSDGELPTFSLAAAIATPSKDGPGGSTDPMAGASLGGAAEGTAGAGAGQGKTGIGIAGDVSINTVTDKAHAFINDQGDFSAGAVTLSSDNSTNMIAASGSVAISTNDKSAGIAGSFSKNYLDGSTKSYIAGANIAQADSLSLSSDREGDLFSLTAGGALAPAQQGIALAGSVSLNQITNTTESYLDDVTGAVTNASSLSAEDVSEMLVIAGSLAFGGKAGVGAAVSYNQIDNTTKACITGSTLAQDGNLSLSATNDNQIMSLAGGIAASKDTLGASGAVSLNFISNRAEASMTDSTITGAPGNDIVVSLLAKDDSLIMSLAGAVGIAKQAGIGGSVAVNSISNTVTAYLDDTALITVGSLSASTDSSETVKTISAGGAGAKTVGLAGAVSVNMITSTTTAYVTGTSSSVGAAGNVTLAAQDEATIQAIAGNVAGAGKAAVGASVGYNKIASTVSAYISGSSAVTSSQGDVKMSADEAAEIFSIAAGAQGAGNFAMGGSVTINQVGNTVGAYIGDSSTVEAYGNVVVAAMDSMALLLIAGVVSISGTAAIGASNTTVVTNNTTTAYIDKSAIVKAKGKGSAVNVATGDVDSGGDWMTDRMRGLAVTAVSSEDLKTFAVGGTGGGEAGIAGSATVNVLSETTKAYIGDGAQINTGNSGAGGEQTVSVLAADYTDILSIAGALTFGGSAGIGAGADVGVITKDTQAYIGAAAVNAKNDVKVQAISSEDIMSIAASLGVGGSAGIGGSASVYVINNTTRAFIGDDPNDTLTTGVANVFADDSILVSAADVTEIDMIAGNITGSGSAGIGAAAGVAVINKRTESFIGLSANVRGKGLNDGITDARTGSFAVTSTTDAPSEDFATADAAQFDPSTAVANDAIDLGFNHGFSAGQAVSYSAGGGVSIGGLEDGQTYYVIAINGAPTKLKLAATEADARAGKAIDLDPTGATGTHSLNDGIPDAPTVEVGAPGPQIDPSNANLDGSGGNDVDPNDPTLTQQRTSAPERDTIRGVAVTAVNQDDIETIVASVGASGSVAVNIGGSVNVITSKTSAFIDDGASVNANNSGADSGQSVLVAAANDYYHMGISAVGSLSGAVAVTPGADVTVIKNTTKAYIDDGADVTARKDIHVIAHASEDILSIAAGVAASGQVAFGGAVSIIYMDNKTHAYIGEDEPTPDSQGATANAGGNIFISAEDHTETMMIVGSLGIGIGAVGAGGSAGVTIINKDTRAYVGSHSVVNAKGDSDALANTVFDGEINSSDPFSTETSFRGLAVQAASSEDVFVIAASAAGGLYAGLAGGVSVEIIDSDTTAYIGANADVNKDSSGVGDYQSVNVSAVNDVKVFSFGGGIAVGIAGIGGGVDVGIIRNHTTAYIGASAEVHARRDVDVNALSNKDIISIAVSGAGGIAAVAGSVSVWSISAAYNSSYSSGSESEDSVNSSKFGDTTNGVDDAADEFGVVLNAFSDDDTNGPNDDTPDNTGLLGTHAGDTADSVGDETPNGEVAAATGASGADAAAGATAYIANGAVVKAGDDVNVRAKEKLDFAVVAGSASVGVVGIGGAVAIANVSGDAEAYIAGAVWAGNETSTGDVLVDAASDESLSASAFVGQVGIVSLGAQVIILNDHSKTKAYLTGTANIHQADAVEITADTHQTLIAESMGGSIGQVAAGVSFARVTTDGSTKAYIAGGAQVGKAAGGSVGSLSVSADADISPGESLVDGKKFTARTIAVKAGLVAGQYNDAKATIDHDVEASIGAADVEVGGGVNLTAKSTAEAKTDVLGVTVGAGIAIGVSLSEAKITSDVATYIAANADVEAGGSIKLKALHNYTSGGALVDKSAYAKANASGGGILSGNGAEPTAISSATVETYVGAGAALRAGNDIELIARSHNKAVAYADGVTVGLLAGLGESLADASVKGKAAAHLDGTVADARDLTIMAQAYNTADAYARASGGGFLSSQGAVANAIVAPLNNNTPSVTAYIGDGANSASVEAARDVTITSQSTNTTLAEAEGKTYAAGVEASYTADSHITNVNLAYVGPKVTIIAGRDFELTAQSNNNAQRSKVEGGGFALVGGTGVRADGDVDDTTKAEVRANSTTSITVPDTGTLTVQALSTIGAHSEARTDAKAGIAVNKVESDTDVTALTKTYIADSAVLSGGVIQLYAEVLALDADADAWAQTRSLDSDTKGLARVDTNSQAQVIVAGADITGNQQIQIVARQDGVDTDSDAYARIVGGTGTVSTDGHNQLDLNSDIDVQNGSKLTADDISLQAVSPHDKAGVYSQSSDAQGDTVVNWVLTQVDKLVKKVSNIPIIGWIVKWVTETVLEWVKTILHSDVNEEMTGDFNPNNSIILNGEVFQGASLSPRLIVAPDGAFSTVGNASAQLVGNDVVVDDIINDSNPGQIVLESPSGSVSGSATIHKNSIYETVTIVNNSSYNLVVNDINVRNPNPPGPDVQVIAGEDTTAFNYVTDVGIPTIIIENNPPSAASNVTFAGEILNATGLMTVVNVNGDVLDQAGASIEVNRLWIEASNGAIGAPGDSLGLRLVNDASNAELSAAANGGIYLDTRVLELQGSDFVAPSGYTIDGAILGAAITIPDVDANGAIIGNNNVQGVTAGGNVNVEAEQAQVIVLSGDYGEVRTPVNVKGGYNLDSVASTGGNVDFTNNSGAVNVGFVGAVSGGVTMTTLDSISEYGDDANSDINAVNVTLTTQTGGIAAASNVLEIDSSNASPGLLNATAEISVYLNEVIGDMNVGLVTSNSGLAALTAIGAILDTSDAGGDDIVAVGAVLTAGVGAGAAANPLETTLGKLEASAGSGGVWLDNTGDLTIGGITAQDSIIAATTVDVSASGWIHDTADAGGNDIAAAAAVLSGAAGIGTQANPLETAVQRLEADGGSGGVWIVNTGGLTIGQISSLEGLSADGPIVVTALSPLTVREDVVSMSDITLTAQESAGPGDDLTVTDGAMVDGDLVTLLAGDDLMIDRYSLVRADSDLVIRGDHGDLDPGVGARIDIDGQLDATSVLITTVTDNDVIDLHPQSLIGHTFVLADAGDDQIIVNQLPSMTTEHNGIRDTLDLDGQGGSDAYTINVNGADDTDYIMNVHDTGARDDGADVLTINGTDDPDAFLLRRYFVAYMHGSSGAGFTDEVERINYDENINARLRVNAYGGDDEFFSDDNSAITTLDGGEGNDYFQIGQVFGSDPNDPGSGVLPGDEIEVTEITRGYLSRGISFPMTVFGGYGDDVFSVYSNKAVLRLEGNDGNDDFVIRAFVRLSDNSSTGDTLAEVHGGAGDDYVEYNINAPVSINGGAGFDTIFAVGSELDDAFVVTDHGIFGAGLNIEISGVEEAVEVDGLEGDDQFFVLSTRQDVVTTLIGGLGSDTFSITGDVTETIIAAEMEGRSGVINHQVISNDLGYDGLLVDGIDLNVADKKSGKVVIEEEGGATTVSEDIAGSVDTYTVSMGVAASELAAPTVAYVTVSAMMASTDDRNLPLRGGTDEADTVLVSTDGVNYSRAVVLTFDSASNWANAQTIYVKAAHDSAEEGERTVVISHSILSDNPDFNGVPIKNVQVQVLDDDKAGILITESGSSTLVLEGAPGVGAITDTYQIALSRQPTDDVTVTLGHDGQISLSDTTLTFTPNNWDTPQVVQITAVNDGAVENSLVSTITHTLTSSDASFDGVSAPDLEVTVLDDDSPGVLVTESDGSTLVVVNGANDTYDLRLTSAPQDDVTVAIYTDGQTLITSNDARFFTYDDPNTTEVEAIPAVTFSTADWFNPVTLEVAADPNFDPSSPTFVKRLSLQSHTASRVRGPIVIEGGTGQGSDRSLRSPVMLPYEWADDPLGISVTVDENLQTDSLNVFNDSSVSDDVGALGVSTADGTLGMHNISGLGMAGDLTVNEGTNEAPLWVTYSGGVSYNALEVVEVLLGSGNDTFTVESTAEGSITVIHGGGNNPSASLSTPLGSINGDYIVVTGGGGPTSPLVIYGDTSQDGTRYSSTPAAATGAGIAFDYFGDDIIDASTSLLGVTIYGGGGNDVIYGSQGGDHLAGGAGDDEIHGLGGADHIYGDSGFNTDLSVRLDLAAEVLTVATTETGGSDLIYGGADEDIIFGDHGVITQTPGVLRITTTGSVERVDATNIFEGDGDTVFGGGGDDIIHGGYGDDLLYGDAGDDELYGELGNDTIFGGDGSDVIFGDVGHLISTPAGSLATTANGSWPQDVFLEEVGSITGVIDMDTTPLRDLDPDLARKIIEADLVILTGTFNADGSKVINADNGAWDTNLLLIDLVAAYDDNLDGGAGEDLLFGQRGNDTLLGGGENDLIFGDGARNTTPFPTNAPNIYDGIRLMQSQAAEDASIVIETGGAVIVPPIALTPPEFRLNAPLGFQPDIMNLLPQQALDTLDFVGAADLERTDGAIIRSYAAVVSDVVHSLDVLPGNDTIDGGYGDDMIFGDDAFFFSPVLTGLAEINDARDDAYNALYSAIHGLSHLAIDFDHVEHDIEGAVHQHDLHIGEDTISGGEGGDIIFGDQGVVVSSFMTGLPFSEGEFVDQALEVHDYLRDLEYVSLDFDLVILDAHHQTLQTMIDDALKTNPRRRRLRRRSDHDHHDLFVGNDTIHAGVGDDLVIGDSGAIVTHVVDGARLGDVSEATYVNPGVVSDAAAALSTQKRARRQLLRNHVAADHRHESDLHSLRDLGMIVWDYDYELTIGNDAIGGDEGDDLIVGDFGVIVSPVVMEAPVGAMESARLDADIANLLSDIEDYMNDQHPLEAYQQHSLIEHHEKYMHRGRTRQAVKMTAGNDDLTGGLGDDVIVGDSQLIASPLLYETPGVQFHTIDVRIDRQYAQRIRDGFNTYHHGRYSRRSSRFNADLVQGDEGDDLLFGQWGNDDLRGGDGADTLLGGGGRNRVNGGAGKDYVRRRSEDIPRTGDMALLQTYVFGALKPSGEQIMLDVAEYAASGRHTGVFNTLTGSFVEEGGASSSGNAAMAPNPDPDPVSPPAMMRQPAAMSIASVVSGSSSFMSQTPSNGSELGQRLPDDELLTTADAPVFGGGNMPTVVAHEPGSVLSTDTHGATSATLDASVRHDMPSFDDVPVEGDSPKDQSTQKARPLIKMDVSEELEDTEHVEASITQSRSKTEGSWLYSWLLNAAEEDDMYDPNGDIQLVITGKDDK